MAETEGEGREIGNNHYFINSLLSLLEDLARDRPRSHKYGPGNITEGFVGQRRESEIKQLNSDNKV